MAPGATETVAEGPTVGAETSAGADAPRDRDEAEGDPEADRNPATDDKIRSVCGSDADKGESDATDTPTPAATEA